MLKSFKPVADDHTKILVVGSMPGEASLKARQYYAYKYNHFWRIISVLFNCDKPFSSYREKLSVLSQNSIGLWDSLKYCRRQGSLDKDIKYGKANNFSLLFKKYPSIKRIVFNGRAAEKFFKENNPLLSKYEYVLMPSTSPANAGKSFEEKLSFWRKVLLIDNQD